MEGFIGERRSALTKYFNFLPPKIAALDLIKNFSVLEIQIKILLTIFNLENKLLFEIKVKLLSAAWK